MTQIELYEKRLDLVTQLIETLEEGSWAQRYWIGVYASLINTLNRIIQSRLCSCTMNQSLLILQKSKLQKDMNGHDLILVVPHRTTLQLGSTIT